MTALAMIIGMVRMALGLGDGGEQIRSAGTGSHRGLVFATLSTLLFVPGIFQFRCRAGAKSRACRKKSHLDKNIPRLIIWPQRFR